MASDRHSFLGGKVQVYRRPNSPSWQCSASVGGKQFRASTKTDSFAQAKAFAEDWYLTLRGKERFGGGIAKGKTFRQAADQFLREFEVITHGERNPNYVASKGERLRVHLLPFFGDKVVSEITPGLVQEYRVHRMTSRKNAKGEVMRPARSTIHGEIVTLRQVLKTANRHGWLQFVPDLSAPYKGSGKISHRAWFSPEEYVRFYKATGERAKNPPHPKWKWECEQLHDYVLFMANTGLRPDEASLLQFRDVSIVEDEDTGERILEIEVRGKRGTGYCKSMPGAVHPFERLSKRLRAEPAEAAEQTRDRREKPPTRRKRGTEPTRLRGSNGGRSKGHGATMRKPLPTDLVFGKVQRGLFNKILGELKLKQDRDGQPRTAYSLRHTYISMRLMDGADIYQIAKNCRTSVEMIEKFYASHIKNTLDASAINVRKAKKGAASEKATDLLAEA